MKKYILLIAILSSINGFGQSSLLNRQEEQILIQGIMTNVVSTTLKGDLQNLEKSWSNFAKENIEQKMKRDENFFISNEIVVNQITDKRGDLLVYLYNKDSEVSFNMAFRLGYDVYLNSDQFAEEYNKMEEFLNYFTYTYYNDFLPTYIKTNNKSLKILNKELKNAQKSNSKSAKSNKKIKKKVSKLELKVGKVDTNSANFEIGSQEKVQAAATKKEYETSIAEFNQQYNYNVDLIRINDELTESLGPKIKQTTENISSARLTLIEVRSKLKSFK